MLPLGPTSYGDSPYQSFSTFAGNPYFIDLDMLIDDGLLKKSEVAKCQWGTEPRYVDYGKIYESRFQVLALAEQRVTRSRWPLSGRKTAAGWRITLCTWPASGISA